MTSYQKLISFAACGLFFLCSCNTRPPESTEPSDGMAGEVMIVAEEDVMEEIKENIKNLYHSIDSTLLIAENAEAREFEKKFSFWFTSEKSFDGSEKKAPVILLFGEAGDYTSWLKKMHPVESFSSKLGFTLQVYRNVWAKPQTVIRMRYGRDIEPAEILVPAGVNFIDSVLSEFSIAQGFPGNIAPNKYSDSVSQLIKNSYGFTFQFPPQFRLVMSNQEIVWLRQETGSFYRDIFVNIFSDSAAINSKESAVANRDKFSLKYLKNTEGTDVKVSSSSLFPIQFTWSAEIGKYKAKVLRGWYQEDGTFRRGPFVRYIFHDKKRQRFIAMDGFVYAPNMARLPFYRTFDLIAETFRIE